MDDPIDPVMLITQLRQAANWMGGASLLRKLADELERLHEKRPDMKLILDQAQEGVFAEHQCPAYFACCAIVAELSRKGDKHGIP